jgi:hypothetical protein
LRSCARARYDRFLVVGRALLVAVVACVHAEPARVAIDEPSELPADQVRHYTIWLGGARVGTAVERETWTRAGVALRRDETMRFTRGDAELQIATTIAVDADVALVPSRVRWSEASGSEVHAAAAVHGPRGWTASNGAAIADTAVPAEIVPLVVRRDGRFAGPVFLPARGFVGGAGRVERVANARLVARVALASGARLEATIDLDRDGTPARIVDGDGVIAMRATPAQAAERFPSLDLVAATAIEIAGRRAARPRLALDGDLALPPLPGQRARPTSTGVEVDLDRALPGELPPGPGGPDRAADIARLVAGVRARIAPDLGTAALPARDAAGATAGDCTTFALAYAAAAQSSAIPTRVVTGLRVDATGGDRLIRHRWAVSWTGRAWIAVDAAFGATPAGGDLVGLAVHDADDAGLSAGEAALTRVRAATWR